MSIILVLLVLAGLGAGAYFIIRNNKRSAKPVAVIPSAPEREVRDVCIGDAPKGEYVPSESHTTRTGNTDQAHPIWSKPRSLR